TKTWTKEFDSQMGKLTSAALKGLIKNPGRHGDGGGLFFRVVGEAKAYWTYRYRVDGKVREPSIGPYPELGLAEARAKHVELRMRVIGDPAAPLAEKRAAKEARTTVRTFGQAADDYIAAHEGLWKNDKHRDQWKMTLSTYCAPIRDMPVDQINTEAVLRVLQP